MPTMKMTKRAADALPAPDPSGRQTLYWAGGNATPGLGILVSGVTTSKSWVCQGNLPNGKTRRITLGPVAVLTIEQAWEEAKPKLAAMLAGRDPKLTVPQRKLAGMTVAEVLGEYLDANSNLKPATIKMYRKSASHLGPLLNRTLRDISAEEVERQFRAITRNVAERRARGEIKGGVNVTGKAIANCAARLVGSIWEWHSERDAGLGKNPVHGRRFEKQWHRLDRRTRHIAADQLAEFYDAARRLLSDIQRDLVLVALFTGLREREAAGLRWSEVDLSARLLRLPAARMKGKRQLDLPMTDVVHSMLITRRALGREGAYVFPSHRAESKTGYTASFQLALSQIGKKSGLRLSPHDLRRTYASVAATCAIPPIALKMLIAHSTGADVTSGYTILSPAQLREAAQTVADKMKELCGITESAGDNIARLG